MVPLVELFGMLCATASLLVAKGISSEPLRHSDNNRLQEGIARELSTNGPAASASHQQVGMITPLLLQSLALLECEWNAGNSKLCSV